MAQMTWRSKAAELVKLIVDGFLYCPWHSDLDDEQTIYVRMTLGDYRKAVQLYRNKPENLL